MADDKALKAMAMQLGSLDKRLGAMDERLDENTGALGQHSQALSDLLTLCKQIQATQSALASSVGLAMSELAIARGLERRVDRLEAAVFPAKH